MIKIYENGDHREYLLNINNIRFELAFNFHSISIGVAEFGNNFDAFFDENYSNIIYQLLPNDREHFFKCLNNISDKTSLNKFEKYFILEAVKNKDIIISDDKLLNIILSDAINEEAVFRLDYSDY